VVKLQIIEFMPKLKYVLTYYRRERNKDEKGAQDFYLYIGKIEFSLGE
jgi:hypothetical protein